MTFPVPVIGIAAWSGTGKTTLLKKLIPLLKDAGIRTGLVKHTHHDVDVDQPGKDSYELRHAGAEEVLLASNQRWALVHENREVEQPPLEDLIGHMSLDALDLVLVEGFRQYDFPRIEIHRSDLDKPFLYPGDSSIIALITDVTDNIDTDLPVLDLNQPEQVSLFILEQILSR